MLRTGDQAPHFRLEADDGRWLSLEDMKGHRVLLVFYPGDDTPVCTRQLCDYRDGAEAFGELGVRVIGISRDARQSHEAFKAKHDLPFSLLSDPDLSAAAAYGAKGMMGMKRAVFLLDEQGVVRYQHVETVAVFRRRREALLQAVRALDVSAD